MIETDINYPDGLPWPTRDGYDVNTVQPFRRTQMVSGRSRNRRIYESVPTAVSVTWLFHGDGEAAAFEAWFRDALLDGTEWFNCPLKTPMGEKQYVCQFTSMYTGPVPVGICAYRVTAQLEIWERPLMPPGWGLAPEYLIHADLLDIAMNKEWPEAK